MKPSPVADPVSTSSEFKMLAEQLQHAEPDAEVLRRYYDCAVQTRKLRQARRTLAELQETFPGNHNIRKLYIATCMQLNDFPAAMDGIQTLVAFSCPDDPLLDSALSVRDRIGPRVIDPEIKSRPTLSLCMIVKNEVSRLGPCLNAVQAVADEIVVVDTGSNDRTADIARIFGARVYACEWREDFSAARNYALEKARGDWILILDADEIIAPGDLPSLRRLIGSRQDNPCAFSMETRNYTHLVNALNWQANSGHYPLQEAGLGWFPSRKIRIFQRCADIRFSFPIHELVEPAVRAARMPVVHCPIPVHHYGHLNEIRNKKKAVDYFRIGYAKLDQLGQDFAALRELAVQAGQLECWGEAMELWKRLIQIQPKFTEAYVNMAGASWQTGNYQQALHYSKRALELDPGLKEAYFNLAVSHLMLGNAHLAVPTLNMLVANHDGYLAARFMLGAAFCATGNFMHADTIFSELAASPAGSALSMAVKDLTNRLESAGLRQYADPLTQCASKLRLNGNNS